MPFIGKNPTAGFSTIVKDDLTPDGSTTAFTLSKNVASANDIAVFVGNVRQEPTDAYSVSGTTLTMTAAPASGLNFYVLHIAGTLESSVIPADNTISTAKIQSSAITDAKIAGMASSKLTGNVTASQLASTLDLSSKTVNISNVNNTFPAGHIVQTVYNTPGTTIHLELSTSPPGFTEFHSSYRTSITPKFSNSILKLTWNGLIGGRNQGAIMSFKFYDITNSSNVQTSTLGTGSNRTFCNASIRDMASDTNDRCHLNMIAYQAASNTTARTYGVYGGMESGSTFNVNMTGTDNAGCSYVSPSFTIEEIAQ